MAKAETATASANALLALGDVDGACNRAYYAMFDAARAALLATNGSVRSDTGKTHRGTLNAFSEHFVKTGRITKELGRLLKHAETFRYVADYEGGSVELVDARELVLQAEHFVATLRTIVTPQRDQGSPP
ncbi:MAG: HEPN domain-containing protein [Rhodoferax sp.]|nr:HEPN domain-containing protein [Rhodoferax sp.]NCS61894.1 HEPN domain-containing protein [Rhodoferax sp.]OIP16469.1 MAG: DNA-binding protein [Comamonadaceae bacterium CG2_30_57_122]